ncbi:2,3-bisphosphoglycerate-independent phosphoglycerate mutase [Coxiella burnetii]|uniref:2,3-bisphosphoglycerate-independent phosphoglycerate mutase n=1 Tax=Coxiella burnetii (strain RSA 331 / Henzerling II) TaxID=360115 RepID=GPMI_COXBR|nr:2,3-bisphosphoglycerate-independent phosphoglycerate mutase [Coxiella burnetii]A9N970.1 RecName: Full=2,3-bisphosphoglycerate-independent phosphoglycerate mutase; Short=BPG-independent PGAM; Short=Phosphoglyceromutase; Short=iPGM [Coxiella burnetii RSA 331]ABX77950.1 2,3-bisphosphoglycerate-independent phosphoglycerate mutase [Coxiella burnetii RSA 331]ATN82559.1 2,3-bisphosphoglycerate-independent phosphoglycerate mutase [Coxiella burnetii]ATN84463.1 2,3-bisphosphoglycerate-independent phos
MTQADNQNPKPMVLIILDGFGESDETTHNAIKEANTPTLDKLFRHYPHTLLEASGRAVGLPDGQMGNSEVGHLHIGGGRKVPQDLTRIDAAIASGEFYENPALIEALEKAKALNKAVHILGLLSPGGVHSRDNQIAALVELAHHCGIKKIYLHAILDGRDTPPKSALLSIEKITDQFHAYGNGKIASLIGRYYAMDRDKRWDRTEKAYDLLTQGTAQFHALTAKEGLMLAYEQGNTDEFVSPTSIHRHNETPITIEDGDVVVFMNFRADRARQLTYAFLDDHFTAFNRQVRPKLSAFVTLTAYAKDIHAAVAFPPLELHNTLGEYLSARGYRQLRIAETEKYAHVTYFLNGGQEAPFNGEDRLLIPSPKVATYDLQPEMSAVEMTNKLVEIIQNDDYDLIVCNFANPDMVGHTGDETATREAIQVIDDCLKRIITALQSVGGEALITADHGNAEKMFDEKTNQPHTAHTSNLVPLIYVGREAQFCKEVGALDDVAPTLLYLMGLEKPREMTGRNLITLK